MKDYKIFGIAGTMASGKDTIGNYLAREHDFLFVSVSEILRDEARSRGQSTSRKVLRAISAEWRREHGYAVLVDKAVAVFEAGGHGKQHLAIASIRHPSETDRIHELGGIQIWTDADQHIRFDRVHQNDRGRPDEDNRTFEQFKADEAAEATHEGDGATLNFMAVKPKADTTVYNDNNDIADFEQKAHERLKDHL